jgi:hypothetical protein
MFSEGRASIEDEHRVGRPVEIATPATLQRVEDIIRADRRVTIDAIATAIGCSHGQAYNMMHERLGERFPDDDMVEGTVCAWFRHQPQAFYAAGYQRLVKRWDKCLNLYGDYFEK